MINMKKAVASDQSFAGKKFVDVFKNPPWVKMTVHF